MKKMGLTKDTTDYIAPQVRIIEVEVEEGFAVSGVNDPWKEEE